MRRSCEQCAHPVLAVHETCPRCQAVLLTSEEAVQMREYWDRFPPDERKKIEADYVRMVAEMRRAREWLDRWGGRFGGAIGATVLGLVAPSCFPVVTSGAATELAALVGAASGAAAGIIVHRAKGGFVKGMILFGVAYGATLAFMAASGRLSSLQLFAGAWIAAGMAAALATGAALGSYLENLNDRAA